MKRVAAARIIINPAEDPDAPFLQKMQWPMQDGSIAPEYALVANLGGESPNAAANAQLESRIHQLEGDVERRAAQAYQQGRKEGEAAAETRIRGEVDGFLSQLARSIDQIAGMEPALRHRAEEEVVRLSLAIAKRILHREISVDQEALIGIIRAALDRIDRRELRRIRISTAHHNHLMPHLQQLRLPERVEIINDSSLEPGGVVLETERGSMDCSVYSQLDEIERGFHERLRGFGGDAR
jgi:flagellar assembly protein FliH